jgi:hypothetical protein
VVLSSGQTKLIKRRGKVQVAAGEKSSYRVEVEGLIQLYTLLPTHIHTRHACDNEAAVKAHYTTQHHAALDYRVTLDRLNTAITDRGGEPIDVIHTHSHLENVPTLDLDVHQRRQILAIADFQADRAHIMQPTQCNRSYREIFRSRAACAPQKECGTRDIDHTNDPTNARLRTAPHGRRHSHGHTMTGHKPHNTLHCQITCLSLRPRPF